MAEKKSNKRILLTNMAALIAIMVFFVSLIFFFLTSGFYYRFSDLTKGPKALNSGWTIEADNGSIIEQDVSLPYIEPAIGTSITITRKITAEDGEVSGIIFNNARQSVSVYNNDELCYSVNQTWLRKYIAATGLNLVNSRWNEGDVIRIHIVNEGQFSYKLAFVKTGSMMDLAADLVLNDSICLFNILALVIFSLILLGASIYFRIKKFKDKRLTTLSIFALLVAVWSFCDSSLIFLLPLTLEKAAFTTYMLFLFVPIPPLFYVLYTFEEKHDTLQKVIYLNYIIIAIRLLLAVTGVLSLNHTLLLSHVGLLITIVVCIYEIHSELVVHSTEWNLALLAGFAILFTTTLGGIVVYYLIGGAAYRAVSLSGISIFFANLLIIALFSNANTLQLRSIAAEKYKRLEHESKTDNLTSLGNRRAFEDALAMIGDNPEEYADAILVMLDLNGLKVTNDTHGHNAGDELIITAARCISETIGKGCRCYRIGGDEFTTILHNYSGSIHMRLAEMRRWIDNYNEQSVYKLSIAHGESTLRYLNDNYRTISDWKQDADINMYTDKRLNFYKRNSDLVSEYQEIIRCMLTAIETNDNYFYDHSNRVRCIAVMTAKKLNFTDAQIHQIETAALLHDIGKISIPDDILFKPTALNQSEFDLVKKHSAQGASILSHSNAMQEIADIILHHHERYDGKGYPDGLSGDYIPIGSRIIFIADSISAMASKHTYRDAYDINTCRKEIENNLGTMYDPEIGRVVLNNWREVVDILLTHPNNLF